MPNASTDSSIFRSVFFPWPELHHTSSAWHRPCPSILADDTHHTHKERTWPQRTLPSLRLSRATTATR